MVYVGLSHRTQGKNVKCKSVHLTGVSAENKQPLQSVAELRGVSCPPPSLHSRHFLNILIAYWSHVWGERRDGLITSFSSEMAMQQ